MTGSADDLYGLPLERFTSARDALARSLAKSDREEAGRVKKLRKPTVAAWAVNQLVRTQPKAIEALFAAGDALAEAQAKGQTDDLRAAMTAQRDAQQTLVSRAEGLLDEDGRALSAAVLERVGETLRAASLDPETRIEVESGCLTKELQLSGFLGLASGRSVRPKPKAKPDQATHRAARERQQQAEAELRRARSELETADRELAGAQHRRDAAAKALTRAETALYEAREAVKRLQRGQEP